MSKNLTAPAPNELVARAAAVSEIQVTPLRLRSDRSLSRTVLVRLSIVMPVFNEEATIEAAVAAVLAADYPCPIELVIVDDGSTDRTPELLSQIDDRRVRVLRHPRNRGKGAALFSGATVATGSYLLPFDADLEYSPDDIAQLLEPVIKGRCEVVYGTRLFGVNTVYQSYRYAMGNKLSTLAANVLFDSYLSDLHTCLKLVPLALFRDLPLRERGFGLDTEITATLLRRGVRPFEVPVSYHSRSHAQGKKITWRDGIACLQILGRVRFARPARRVSAMQTDAQEIFMTPLRVVENNRLLDAVAS